MKFWGQKGLLSIVTALHKAQLTHKSLSYQTISVGQHSKFTWPTWTHWKISLWKSFALTRKFQITCIPIEMTEFRIWKFGTCSLQHYAITLTVICWKSSIHPMILISASLKWFQPYFYFKNHSSIWHFSHLHAHKQRCGLVWVSYSSLVFWVQNKAKGAVEFRGLEKGERKEKLKYLVLIMEELL